MAWETGVQAKIESYQRLKKRYLILPCLTLRIIRYGSRVKWSNPGKGVVPYPTLHLRVVAIEKGAFELPSTMVANFTFCNYNWYSTSQKWFYLCMDLHFFVRSMQNWTYKNSSHFLKYADENSSFQRVKHKS